MPVELKKWLFTTLMLCCGFSWYISPVRIIDYNLTIHFIFVAIFFINLWLEVKISNIVLFAMGILSDIVLHDVLFLNSFLFILLSFTLNFHLKHMEVHKQYHLHMAMFFITLTGFYTCKYLMELIFRSSGFDLKQIIKSILFTTIFYGFALPALNKIHKHTIKKTGTISR
jgi:cell shape-determining protein MreD